MKHKISSKQVIILSLHNLYVAKTQLSILSCKFLSQLKQEATSSGLVTY